MPRLFTRPTGLLVVGAIVLVVYTISDCLRRREHPFWIVIIVLFWMYIGPLIYLAWTRNWLGRLGGGGGGGFTDAFGGRFGGGRGAARVVDIQGVDTPDAMHKRARVLLRKGKYEQAIELLEEALVREGPHASLELRYDCAMTYKHVGRYRDARDQLSLIVGEDLQYRAGQAFLELADCHQEMGEKQRARELYEQLLERIRFPEARYRYGLLLENLGEMGKAKEQMQALLDEMKNAPDFHKHNNRRYSKLAKQFLRRHR
jgi:tetratricopeptide (TPR) repeat protein